MESRISDKLISAQPVDQAAFRPKLSIIDHLFTIKLVAETTYDLNIPIWIAAVDFDDLEMVYIVLGTTGLTPSGDDYVTGRK